MIGKIDYWLLRWVVELDWLLWPTVEIISSDRCAWHDAFSTDHNAWMERELISTQQKLKLRVNFNDSTYSRLDWMWSTTKSSYNCGLQQLYALSRVMNKKKYTIIVCISACIYSKERMIIFQITCDFRHTGNMGGNKSWLYHNSLCVTVIMFSSVNVETNLFYYYYSI